MNKYKKKPVVLFRNNPITLPIISVFIRQLYNNPAKTNTANLLPKRVILVSYSDMLTKSYLSAVHDI